MSDLPEKNPGKKDDAPKRSFFIQNPIVRRIVRLVLLFLIMGIIAHLMLAERNIYWQDFHFASMSTWVNGRFYTRDKEAAGPASRLVWSSFHEVTLICSLFDPDSEISRLNESAFQKPFHCSEPLWNLLCTARKVYQLSGGAFDVTVGPLMPLWGFQREKQAGRPSSGNVVLDKMPTDQEIADAKKCVGMDKIIFDDDAHTVKFTVNGMKLDLGGIAKGAALDYFAELAPDIKFAGGELASDVSFMKKAEAWFRNKYGPLDCGYVSIGGNVLVLPEPPPKGHDYVAGIRNPLNPNGPVCAKAKMLDECISTSGNYERFTVINGHRYTHIIDPRTGRPVENMLSVSVIAKSGAVADALSTAIFVGGRPVADAAAKEYPDLRVLAYYVDPGTGKVASWQIGEWESVTIPEIPAEQPEKTKSIPVMSIPAR